MKCAEDVSQGDSCSVALSGNDSCRVTCLPCCCVHAGLGEVTNTVSKVVQLLAAYVPGWSPTAADAGDIAPAAAGTPEAADAMLLSPRLLVYEELAKDLANTEELEAYIKKLERQEEQAAGGLAPAAELNLFQKIVYAKDLLLTLLTDWSDNPEPPVGVFNSKEGGNWGGPMHSLQVRGKVVCACTS